MVARSRKKNLCSLLVISINFKLNDYKEELDRRGISFLGFHYIPKAFDPIDERIAKLQYKTIIDQKGWLSDEEAKKHLFASSITVIDGDDSMEEALSLLE